MFHKPPLFYALMSLAGVVLGEVLSAVLPLFVPHSGALEAITYRFSFGFRDVTLDLYFLILSVGFKLEISVMGAFFGVLFLLIGRMV